MKQVTKHMVPPLAHAQVWLHWPFGAHQGPAIVMGTATAPWRHLQPPGLV